MAANPDIVISDDTAFVFERQISMNVWSSGPYVYKDVRGFNLYNELSVYLNINHEHIMSCKDIVLKSKQLCARITTPRGTPLDELLHILDLETRRTYVRQLIQALVHLERHGIIHGDIKPENIIVIKGAIKLTDFGLIHRTWHLHQINRSQSLVNYQNHRLRRVGFDINDSIMTRAMFALGITVAVIMTGGCHDFYKREADGIMAYQRSIYEDAKAWVNALPEIEDVDRALIGQLIAPKPPGSFLDLIPDGPKASLDCYYPLTLPHQVPPEIETFDLATIYRKLSDQKFGLGSLALILDLILGLRHLFTHVPVDDFVNYCVSLTILAYDLDVKRDTMTDPIDLIRLTRCAVRPIRMDRGPGDILSGYLCPSKWLRAPGFTDSIYDIVAEYGHKITHVVMTEHGDLTPVHIQYSSESSENEISDLPLPPDCD